MVIAEHPPGRGPNISVLLGYVSETKSPRAKVSESALTRVNESETITLTQVWVSQSRFKFLNCITCYEKSST